MRPPEPYTARDVATMLGLSTDRFYRRYDELVQNDGMPAAIASRGRKKFHRASIDAWLGRHHPLAIKQAAANDSAPLRELTIDEERRELALAYGG